MKACLALAVVAIFTFSGLAHAQTWTTPDGFLSVTEPDSETFVNVPSPPEPMVGLWISRDESTKLCVVTTDYPANLALIQSAVEEGFAEEIGGEVTRLPTKQIAGYDVWMMNAKGMSADINQLIIRHEGTVYKIMAGSFGENPNDQAINQFIDSLVIHEAAKTPEPMAATTPGAPNPLTTENKPKKNLGSGIDLHNLSKKIGGFAVLLVIGLLIYLVTRGKNKPTS